MSCWFKPFETDKLKEFIDLINNKQLNWLVKRLSGNDTGLTKSHQSGIYVPRQFMEQFLPEICTTSEKNPTIHILETFIPSHEQIIKNVKAKYYNNKFFPDNKRKKEYNEFRFTSWDGKTSPVQNPENTGSIFLIVTFLDENRTPRILCWVTRSISEENIIENWIGSEVYPGEFIGSFLHKYKIAAKSLEDKIPREWFTKLPPGAGVFNLVEKIIPNELYGSNVDNLLIKRRETEYRIFQTIEASKFEEYRKRITDIKELINVANELTNSRKSRSGHSLEYNLTSIFKFKNLKFERNIITENKKKPDFIFPSGNEYHDKSFPSDQLNMLAAKTCCKDRWRQVINEANRIQQKHLFTLQEGVSAYQLKEMADHNVILVVPSNLKNKYPEEWRNKILDLSRFVKMRLKIDKVTNK